MTAAQGLQDAQTVRALDVLVVDDDPASRRSLAQAVLALGQRCRVAGDGREALQLHLARRADVILSEWRMPNVDGLELCRRTREAPVEEVPHFVLITALRGKESFLEGMRAGADDYLVKPLEPEVLDARLRAAFRIAGARQSLVVRSRALERESERLRAAAAVDPLTQASNRLRLERDLERFADCAVRYGHRYCAAVCDIDWFKSYNDQFGHLAGDDALRIVSDAIRGQLRRGDEFYRVGGEEFLAVLPEQSLSTARSCMERVRAAVAGLKPAAEGGPLARRLTISVGLAEFRPAPGGQAIKPWLERADAALYRAKARGRNCVEVDPWSPSGEHRAGPREGT
jgi:diguanylate cyclase (GGDEF)-like protein